MDLNLGPPATDKGYAWGNMRVGGVKARVTASKIWVSVLTMSSFGVRLESDLQRFVRCGEGFCSVKAMHWWEGNSHHSWGLLRTLHPQVGHRAWQHDASALWLSDSRRACAQYWAGKEKHYQKDGGDLGVLGDALLSGSLGLIVVQQCRVFWEVIHLRPWSFSTPD